MLKGNGHRKVMQAEASEAVTAIVQVECGCCVMATYLAVCPDHRAASKDRDEVRDELAALVLMELKRRTGGSIHQ